VLDTSDASKYSGKFCADGRDLDGELTFAGKETQLYLHNAEFFKPDQIEDRCIHGQLRDLTRVSLFDCLAPEISSHSWSQHLGSYYSANVRPQFVLHGRRHISPSDKIIKSIHFSLRDCNAIFPDREAFSTAFQVTPRELRSLLRTKEKITKRRVKIGRRPEVAYFTGKQTIFQSKTCFGKISAHHLPSFSNGGPQGVSIDNRIRLQIVFPTFVTFDEAIKGLFGVLPFFQAIAGRRQEVESLSVGLKARDRLLSDLKVYWCRPPRPRGPDQNALHSIDLPIDATRAPQDFALVLAKWLERQVEWNTARMRFSASFAKENSFDPDRLIGSANMFDLLPKSAVPKSVALAKELKEARDVSRRLFEKLPISAERDSVLNALGRVGHASLKRKVRHLAGPVVAALSGELPELIEVLDLAVDARNHFVHGTPSKINYAEHSFETVVFFSLALEFVFLVFDLLESGWDIQRWRQQGSTLSHPLAQFIHAYPENVAKLKSILPVGHKIKTLPATNTR
jgi:hypothetical protein